jgi:hypothetical protein
MTSNSLPTITLQLSNNSMHASFIKDLRSELGDQVNFAEITYERFQEHTDIVTIIISGAAGAFVKHVIESILRAIFKSRRQTKFDIRLVERTTTHTVNINPMTETISEAREVVERHLFSQKDADS